MTRRKILLEKRNRITDAATEVEDFQTLTATSRTDLSMNVADLVLSEIIWRFTSNFNILSMHGVVFVSEFVELRGIHRILIPNFRGQDHRWAGPAPVGSLTQPH